MSSIFTQSELAAFMGKTLSDAQAKQITNAVNQYVERATGRIWGDSATIHEVHPYKSAIWLRNMDVQNVSKVEFGLYGGTLTELNTTAYYWDALGCVRFDHDAYSVYPTTRRLSVKITYTYGVDEVPEDLKLAALGIAAGFYNWAAGEQREVSATQVGSYRVEYAGNRRASDVIDTTVQSNFAVISSYKQRRV